MTTQIYLDGGCEPAQAKVGHLVERQVVDGDEEGGLGEIDFGLIEQSKARQGETRQQPGQIILKINLCITSRQVIVPKIFL